MTTFNIDCHIEAVGLNFVLETREPGGTFGSGVAHISELVYYPGYDLTSVHDPRQYYVTQSDYNREHNPSEYSGTFEDPTTPVTPGFFRLATGLKTKVYVVSSDWYLIVYPTSDEFFYRAGKLLPAGGAHPEPGPALTPGFIELSVLTSQLGGYNSLSDVLTDPFDGEFIRFPVNNLDISSASGGANSVSTKVTGSQLLTKLTTPRLPKLAQPGNLVINTYHRDPAQRRDLSGLPRYPTTVPMTVDPPSGSTDPYIVDGKIRYGYFEAAAIGRKDGNKPFGTNFNGVDYDLVIAGGGSSLSFIGPFRDLRVDGLQNAEGGIAGGFAFAESTAIVDTSIGPVYRTRQGGEAVWPFRHFPHYIPGETISDVQALEGANRVQLDAHFALADHTPQEGYISFYPKLLFTFGEIFDATYDYVRYPMDLMGVTVSLTYTVRQRPLLTSVTINPTSGVAPAKVTVTAVGSDPNVDTVPPGLPIDFFEVDWGDGTIEQSPHARTLVGANDPPFVGVQNDQTVTPAPDQTMKHTYKAGGTYQILVTAVTYGCLRSLPRPITFKVSDLTIKPSLPDAAPKQDAIDNAPFIVFHPAPVS